MLSNDKEIEEAIQKYGGGKGHGFSFSSSSDNGGNQIIINGQDMMKIKSRAMANADAQMKRMRPMMQNRMKIAGGDWNRVNEEMAKARAEMEASKPDMELAKAEMQRAKEEMIKAKAEMLQAKAEFEKQRAELKKANAK